MNSTELFISIQLFFILLFSKTFGQRDELPFVLKIAIRWSNSAEKESLFKLAANEGKTWNERFELNLFRVDRQSGRAIEPPIANGKTGHYDFAKLTLSRPLRRNSLNVEETERSRKGKGTAETEMETQDGNEFELHIKMNSVGNGNNQQQQQNIIKRLKKLPTVSQILICHFDANPQKECNLISYKTMKIIRPERRIFFQMNLLPNTAQIFKLRGIECAKMKGEFLHSLRFQSNGVEYLGPICPSDEYIIHFLINGKIIEFPYNCDEAIYKEIDKKSNIYELKNNPDGTSECKLLLNDDSEKNGEWKFQELSKQIVESERKIHEMEQQIQPMLWEYFYRQYEIYHKTEQWLEEGEKILQKQNLPKNEERAIQNEIIKIKEHQKKKEWSMPELIAILLNWQNYLMIMSPTYSKEQPEKMIRYVIGMLMNFPLKDPPQPEQSSNQTHPISELLHYIVYHMTQLLPNPSTSATSNQNQPNFQHPQTAAGTSTHLIPSSVPANDSNLMNQMVNLPPSHPANLQKQKAQSEKGKEQMSIERQSQHAETTSTHEQQPSADFGFHLSLPTVDSTNPQSPNNAISERPLQPNLHKNDKGKNGDEQEEIAMLLLGLSGQKRGPNERGGEEKGGEGPSEQNATKKAKKNKKRAKED